MKNALACIVLAVLSGTWLQASAQQTSCPDLEVRNGYASLYLWGKGAMFACQDHHTLVGETSAYCLDDGTWSEEIPVCVGHGCPKLDPLPDVTMTELYNGGIVRFECVDDRVKVGPHQLICDGTQWDQDPPKCLRPEEITSPTSETTTTSTSTTTTTTTTPSPTTTTISSPPPTTTAKPTPTTITSTATTTATQTTAPKAAPTTKAPSRRQTTMASMAARRQLTSTTTTQAPPATTSENYCRFLVLKNGRVRYRHKGLFALFKCRKKFTLVGPRRVDCKSPAWTYQKPVCVRRGCPDLGLLPDVIVTKAYKGGVLRFQCPEGMRRDGPEEIMCNGENWNWSPPICLRLSCPDVGPLPDVTMRKLDKGGTLRFSCPKEMRREGPKLIFCDGEIWSDEPPKCLPRVPRTQTRKPTTMLPPNVTTSTISTSVTSATTTPATTTTSTTTTVATSTKAKVSPTTTTLMTSSSPSTTTTTTATTTATSTTTTAATSTNAKLSPTTTTLMTSSPPSTTTTTTTTATSTTTTAATSTNAKLSPTTTTIVTPSPPATTTTKTTTTSTSVAPTTRRVAIPVRSARRRRPKNACPKLTLKNGKARMRVGGRVAHFRCNKNFQRVGHKSAVCLSSRRWSQAPPVCVGRGCPDLGPLGDVIVTELYRGGILRFTCPKGMRRDGPQEIVCDGENWDWSAPTCLHGISTGCDFEDSSLCGWSQDANDDFDWTWTSGATPTSYTGPDGDHTTGSGHYIFMESSAPRRLGHVTRLLSPAYDPEAGIMCIEFYYHMKGHEVGDLDVYVRTGAGDEHKDVSLFHRDSFQGADWNLASVAIPQQHDVYKIVFAATRGKRWTGDIALDDIKVLKC